MPKPLTVQALDDMAAGGCDTPGCQCKDELVLAARCHPGKGTNTVYQKGDGFVSVVCRVCKSLIVKLAIAADEVH